MFLVGYFMKRKGSFKNTLIFSEYGLQSCCMLLHQFGFMKGVSNSAYLQDGYMWLEKGYYVIHDLYVGDTWCLILFGAHLIMISN